METNEQIGEHIAKCDARIAVLKRRIFWLNIANWTLLLINFGFVFYHSNQALVEAYNHELVWQRIALLALQAFATGFIACHQVEGIIEWLRK